MYYLIYTVRNLSEDTIEVITETKMSDYEEIPEQEMEVDDDEPSEMPEEDSNHSKEDTHSSDFLDPKVYQGRIEIIYSHNIDNFYFL